MIVSGFSFEMIVLIIVSVEFFTIFAVAECHCNSVLCNTGTESVSDTLLLKSNVFNKRGLSPIQLPLHHLSSL